MEKKEAEKVLKIMTSADGGCSHCAGILMDKFTNEFGFKSEAEIIYKKSFDEDLTEYED